MSSMKRIFFDRMLRVPWINYEKFSELEVCVIGLGNTGSPAALMLHSLGLKRLVLIDRDIVEVSNLQRQFLYREGHVNRAKARCAAEVLKHRFKGLETEVEALPVDVTLLNEIDFDFVFLCVDNHRARKHVLEKCLESGTPLIDMGLEFRESQFGYVLLVDKNAFPEGACINCYTDLSKKYGYRGCIAAGVPYSGCVLASVAAGMFVHHLFKPKRVNYFFIDFNSMKCGFEFIKARKSCEVCR